MPKTLTLELPDDAFSALRSSPEEFGREYSRKLEQLFGTVGGTTASGTPKDTPPNRCKKTPDTPTKGTGRY